MQYDADNEELNLGANTVVFESGKLEPDQLKRVVIRLFQKMIAKHFEFAKPGATFKLMDGLRPRAVGAVVELMGRTES